MDHLKKQINCSVGDIINVLQLLLVSGGVAINEDAARRGQQLVEWLREIYAQFYSDNRRSEMSRDKLLKANDLLLTMRDCLLTHRWAAALRVLRSAIYRPCPYYDRNILLVLFELCFQLDIQPSKPLIQFIAHTHLPEDAVALDYMLYSAACAADFDSCLESVKSVQQAQVGGRRCRQSEHHTALTYRITCGLVSYAEYSKCRLSLPSCSEFDEVNRRKLMFAEDAMAQWEGLAAEHGAWDVFIAKHVELLERENDIKQCEALLRSYLRTCAVRANGLRLLYWFYVRRGWADTQQAIDILSELSSMVESDDLVLVFYKLISKEVGNIARITVLFNLLDYASSQDNRRAWNFLCKELAVRNNGLSDSSLAKAMDDCWSIRADWWPQYHFAVFSLPDVASDEALDLIVIKATVAFFLMGSDNPFTQAVLPLTDGISNATRAVRRFKRLLERKLK